MKINQLQKDYIQKSRIFLYPLLGIRRGTSITPIQTYMTWDGIYTVNDYRFIAVYHLRDDEDFKHFEEKKLLGNPLFCDFFELEDGTGAYVFDFSKHKREYKLIVNGKYSMLSDEYKQQILGFFKNHHRHHASILSYLQPQKFTAEYAKLLNCPEKLLKEVGELCSLPDLNLEKLELKKKVYNFESVNNL
jgi:hypothetical protein